MDKFLDAILYGRFSHRNFGGWSFGMIPTSRGEDELRVSMSGVVLSQRDEGRHWKRNKTIFGSLTNGGCGQAFAWNRYRLLLS